MLFHQHIGHRTTARGYAGARVDVKQACARAGRVHSIICAALLRPRTAQSAMLRV